MADREWLFVDLEDGTEWHDDGDAELGFPIRLYDPDALRLAIGEDDPFLGPGDERPVVSSRTNEEDVRAQRLGRILRDPRGSTRPLPSRLVGHGRASRRGDGISEALRCRDGHHRARRAAVGVHRPAFDDATDPDRIAARSRQDVLLPDGGGGVAHDVHPDRHQRDERQGTTRRPLIGLARRQAGQDRRGSARS